WMNNYQEFINKLQMNFGPHDPVGDTEPGLRVGDYPTYNGHHINKYIIEFNRHASQLHGYGEAMLRHFFYNGLPECIKDNIARVGKPSTLSELCTLSQTFDACYWERKSKVT
ncbi:uncharacterized protein EI90DRAFT_2882467, partial [Cantharellus anzutake]|uniref:uncharacterized protein n=1 Tax=Cantharellus anzutake TaxID=1750568 RepID=UPI00190396A4